MKYWTGAHTKHRNMYHIVWIPKYRKKILKNKVKDRVEDVLREVADINNWEIQQMNVQVEHVHLVLDYPFIDLHNNSTESALRNMVIKRKISGSTRSDLSRKAGDIFASLIKTCRKNNISFWDFLTDRFDKSNKIAPLSQVVKDRLLFNSS